MVETLHMKHGEKWKIKFELMYSVKCGSKVNNCVQTVLRQYTIINIYCLLVNISSYPETMMLTNYGNNLKPWD